MVLAQAQCVKWEGSLILPQAQSGFSTGTACEMGRFSDFTSGPLALE